MKTIVINRRLEPEDVYIGRGSPFGNPFIASDVPSKFGGAVRVKNTAEAVSRYRTWLTTSEEIPGWKKPSFEDIWKLRGQRLGCYCKGHQPCHGDVLIELVEAMEEAGGPDHLQAGLEEHEAQQQELIEPLQVDVQDLIEDKHFKTHVIVPGSVPAFNAGRASTIPEREAEHHCHAIGCEFPVPPEMLMCRHHWYMVPKRHRDAVWQTYRPGQCDDTRPSAAWFIAAERAITSVAVREGKISAKEAEARVAREIKHFGERAKADAAKDAEKLRGKASPDDDIAF